MDSSFFSMFYSISVLILLEALISSGFNLVIVGSESGNRAMAIEDEDSMALLPFGSRSGIGRFIRSPQCGGPSRTRDGIAVITVKNSCKNTIWPATNGQPQLSTTGFELAFGASRSLNVPTPWSGRVWARTLCTNDDVRLTCLTGDCSRGLQCNGTSGISPVTLVEFTLEMGTKGTQDFYDISLADGFNIPASITTQEGLESGESCKSPKCQVDVNKVCPVELQVKSNNEVIGCLSACSAFKQPRYCCTGEFSGPNNCEPTSYSQFFKNQCPDAYSYAYDDMNSTFSCSNGPNYVITFCG
ncbi:thaumatin-like protein 1b isoform X1 [Cucurbita moschata]|uniref:Thaumatin-like protein 1b isoform X1 n=1 Tax=Cucurbita moschata TaxID=3662 RepID=A0A6J1H8M8_CUCMO|nr:thaumatin-like protein 1b isoform X1 [Cucurbita moschata]XP_022960883.1 thaumatin-like protein 1b isoform X1 [Cucurbita moschata]